MKFGVIGAGGRLGGKIAAAALDRGIEVTAIVRSTHAGTGGRRSCKEACLI